MKNRTPLDAETKKIVVAREKLADVLRSGIPPDLPLARMLQLANNETEELHQRLAELLYGDTSGVLQYLNTIAMIGPKMSLKPFTNKTQPMKWHDITFWTGENFRQICDQNPNEAKTGHMGIRLCQLAEQANFQTIFAEALGCDPFANWDRWVAQSVPISAVITEIEKTEKALEAGDELRLLTNGYANIFPVPYKINGEPAVVGCGRSSGGWGVRAYPLSYLLLWGADGWIFVRDS